MDNSQPQQIPAATYESSGPLLGILLAVGIGVLAAVVVLPLWAPKLAGTLLGNSPKAYWYLSRGLALVAMGLLWISMVLGLLISDKLSKSWPGAAAAFAVHEFVSLLGIAFAIFHALVLLGDRFIGYSLVQILVPFASTNYRPIWVGLGQICLYAWILISASFYVRKRIGPNTWKLIHFASFSTFVIAVFHGIASGTDTAAPWGQAYYWFMASTLIFLTVYRVAAAIAGPERRTPALATPPNKIEGQRASQG